ncbi:hypothetical protein [Halobacteriovorax sp. JY17]|uniref:hypothetical protein n=1 Tax=Halobacteriovorax sp. JY17 TaxID=2014617 RepID=UPI000C4BC5D9|nr:hypothetical protein [Halobacteriovorax sp. JY17]PIK13651.1 MAG: hypothetical protein CES88_15790 [Halobacteriovorax sp. JY17]
MVKWILTIFLLMISMSSLHASCEELKSDCEYYSCVEEQRHCGDKGYLIGFGKKYCMKFSSDEDYFSDEGKEWIQKVRECLIKNLDLPSIDMSCKKFKRAQIKSHVPCYMESGYCELSRSDRYAVKKVIFKSMWRPSLVWAGIKVIASCRF